MEQGSGVLTLKENKDPLRLVVKNIRNQDIELSDKNAQIFCFIKEFFISKGYAPTVREVGKSVGLSSSTVHKHISNLIQLGVLSRKGNCPRTIIVNELSINSIKGKKNSIYNLDGKFEELYEYKQNWPKGFIYQCGNEGIVLNGNNSYITAFFEALTKDYNFLVVRGEGKSIEDAENEAWKQYLQKQKILEEAGSISSKKSTCL